MAKQIPITTITPNPSNANSDGYDLSGYLFKVEETALNMYAPAQGNQDPVLVKGNITPGTAFPLNFPAKNNKPACTINVTVNSYLLTVSGGWVATEPGITGDPGTGTFQAQAGGGTAEDEDIASSATA